MLLPTPQGSQSQLQKFKLLSKAFSKPLQTNVLSISPSNLNFQAKEAAAVILNY